MPSSFEAIEFEELIGNQLVTMGRSYKELYAQGEIELTIDGQKVSIERVTSGFDPAGKAVPARQNTIYDAANKLFGQENPIPILCHREHMTPVAVCRVCVVDVKGAPRLVPACQRPVEPGMEVSTILTSQRVRACAGTLVEMLLSDYHPPRGQNLESGENELEKIARILGIKPLRFPRRPAERPSDDSSLLISVDHNSCILCDRCIRGCNEIRDNQVLGRMGKGYTARIAFDLDNPMGASSCVTCGECMVSCPTGALSFRATGHPEERAEGDVDPEYLSKLTLCIKAEDSPQSANGEQNGEDRLATEPAESDGAATAESDGAATAAKKCPPGLVEFQPFKGVSLPFLKWNRSSVVKKSIKKGAVICLEGDYGSTAFIIEQGRFEVRIKSRLTKENKGPPPGVLSRFFNRFSIRGEPDAAEKARQPFIPIDAPVALEYGDPVAILDPSDFIFGEMTCMNHYPRSATVTALDDDCAVLEIQRNVLYMLQRSKASREVLDNIYRRRTLATHLRSVRLFVDLIPAAAEFNAFVALLQPKVQLVRVQPGQVFIRQGARADYFYMVRSGFVKVSQTRQGIDRVLNYVGPGGYIGEIGLLGAFAERLGASTPGVRTATCSALDHVDLVRLDEKTFLEMLDRFPQVREHLVENARKTLEENKRQLAELEQVSLGEYLSHGLADAKNVLVLDLERCTRCDECTKACADTHGGTTRLIREGLRFDKYLVATSCRSCLDPYCLVGCPVAAIERTDKGDIHIKGTCIGCGNCADNCPYGNILMAPEKTGKTMDDPEHPGQRKAVVQMKATTCDKCETIVPEGKQPSCVFACPHEAAERMSGKKLLELVKQRNAKG